LWRTGASADGDVENSQIIDGDGGWMIVSCVVSPVRTEVLVATRIFDVIIRKRDCGRAGIPEVQCDVIVGAERRVFQVKCFSSCIGGWWRVGWGNDFSEL